VVEIDSVDVNAAGTGGFLNLEADDGEPYGSFPFHVDGEDGESVQGFDNVWTWENPTEAAEKHITLSPSIVLRQDGEEVFHIFVRDGEVVDA